MYLIYTCDRNNDYEVEFIGYCKGEENAYKICAEYGYHCEKITNCEVPNIELTYKYKTTYREVWDNIKQKYVWANFPIEIEFWEKNTNELHESILRKTRGECLEVIIFLNELNKDKAQKLSDEMLDKYLEGELK